MQVLADVGTRLIRCWGLDGVHMAALARVQRRLGHGGAASAPADVHPRPRWLTATPYLEFAPFAVLGQIGIAGILFPSFFLGLVFSYTVIMAMFGPLFLRRCTTVLLDTSENRVLLHLPISDRTLLAVRLLSIAKHAGCLLFAISLPTAIALAVRFGAVALLVFEISLVLTLLFLVAITLAICLFTLRHVNPARIKEGILAFQAVFFILALSVAGLALTGPSFVKGMPEVSRGAWWYFYPPAWMAGLLEYSLMGKTRFNSVLAATAALAPLASFVGCIQLFAGGRFTELLSRMEVPSNSAVTPKRLPRWLTRLSKQISVLTSADKQERAVFDLTAKLSKNDWGTKWYVYAIIGGALFNCGLCVVMLRHRPMGNLALFVYCYTPISLAVGVRLIQYGAEWRAAWCYQVLPFAKPGVITSGATKLYICRYLLPIYLVLLAAGATFWGATVALNTLFALAVVMLVCIHCFWGATAAYSKDPWLMAKGFEKIGNFIWLALVVGLIATHIVLEAVAGTWGVIGGIVVMGGAIMFAFRRLRSRNVSADPVRGWSDENRHLAACKPPST